jgi:hypothetical protein
VGTVSSVSSVTSSGFVTSSVSSSTSTSSGTTGGGIAMPCTTDADCAAPLACVRDTDNDPIFGGGPAGGFCTTACMSDADCPDPEGVCLQFDPMQSGRCTLSCMQGPPIQDVNGLFSALDPTKCNGRPDLRCAALKSGGAVCVPTCGEDAQCEGGRVCDPRLAVCVDQANAGLPTGQLCAQDTSPTPCAGVCVGFSSGVAICSSPCVLGDADPLQSEDCGGPERGFCAFRPAQNGSGDTGYCTPSCAAQSDCPIPSFFCFGVPQLTPALHVGYCFGADACPNGQGDCIAKNDSSYTCTPTPAGFFCLDPAFPLDGMGTGGTSGAGGGSAGTGGASAATGGAGTGGAGGASTGSTSSGSMGAGPPPPP